MKLQTQIPLEKAKHQIDYNSQLVLLGSCFVENIGEKLDYFKFQNLQNPFGILFHPLTIEKLVTRSVQKQPYTEEDVFFLNERWHCFDAHSDLSDVSKEKLVQKLNEGQKATRQAIANATHLVITLGTAWVYMHKETRIRVANCHKVPQKAFDKLLLEVPEIVESLVRTVYQIRQLNKTVQIISTVSPVRHLKDGFMENQRSKAHLIAAVQDVASYDVKENILNYFPSYELMMDELRDYRFYKSDMVHPNDVAVAYIWEKFKHVWIAEETEKTMTNVAIIQKGLAHKPFNPDSEQHQKFIASLNIKIEILQKEFPWMLF